MDRKPLRIGLFTDTYEPQINGIVTSVNSLRDAIIARGHEVFVFSPKMKGDGVAGPYAFKQRAVPYPFQPEYRMASMLSRKASDRAREMRLDIVHAHSEMGMGIVAARVARMLGVPHFFTLHVMLENFRDYFLWGVLPLGITRDYLSSVYMGPDFIIAPSEKIRHYLRDTLEVDRPIEVIPTGLDLERFYEFDWSPEERNAWRRGFGISEDNMVIASVGRISDEKGIDVALRGIPRIRKDHPKVKYLIVGGGPAERRLKELARLLGIEREVVFTGYVKPEDIPRAYKAADVFAFTGTSESQGLVTIEAMACGLPVVMKRDPGGVNEFEAGGHAILFDDDAGFPEAVARLLADSRNIKSMAEEARELTKLFGRDRFGARVEDYYYRAIDQYSAGPPYGLPQFFGEYARRRLRSRGLARTAVTGCSGT